MTDTPWHFWIIVTIAILWHGFGAFDYAAIQYDWGPWLAMATGPQERFIAYMPAWVDGAWRFPSGSVCWALLCWPRNCRSRRWSCRCR